MKPAVGLTDGRNCLHCLLGLSRFGSDSVKSENCLVVCCSRIRTAGCSPGIVVRHSFCRRERLALACSDPKEVQR
jgi:hypothetical protein